MSSSELAALMQEFSGWTVTDSSGGFTFSGTWTDGNWYTTLSTVVQGAGKTLTLNAQTHVITIS